MTWDDRDSSTAWTDPGGTFASPFVWHTATGSRVAFRFTTEAAGWLVDPSSDHGVVSTPNGSGVHTFATSHNTDSSLWPELAIDYIPLVGHRPIHTFVDLQLSDRRAVHVNVASGNLNVVETDLVIAGTAGLDLDVERAFNSRNGRETESGELWHMTPQSSFGLWEQVDGSMLLLANTEVTFARRQATGEFVAPSGFRGSLVENSDGTFTVHFDRSGVDWVFTSSGYIDEISDRNGNTLDFGYSGSEMTSITDTQGRVTTFTWGTVNGDRRVLSMEGPGGRDYTYGYVADRLETYTDPAGQDTDYTYTSSGLLSQIVDAESSITLVAYDGDGRVTELVRGADPVTHAGPTWTFDYTTAWQTTVTDPNSNDTVYHFDRLGRVTEVVDAQGRQRATSWTSGCR